MADKPTGSSIPLTGIYLEQQNLAEKAYQDALSEINRKRGEMLRLYGYTGKYDDKGNLTNSSLDPNNPYGSYQQLGRAEVADRDSARDAAYDRGLDPTSGLGSRPVRDVRQSYDQGRYDLLTGMLESTYGLTNEQTGAQQQLAQAMLQAKMGAIEESKQERLYTQAQKQFQAQMSQNDAQFQQQMAAQNQANQMQYDLAQQQMAQVPATDPFAMMDPYAGMATISSYDASVMQQYGSTKGSNRPEWVKAIFQAHPGFLNGSQQYVII